MAIDYSKWDKLELSDDSDIEVHPNVDKKSFIRWKQQDIHQKRTQRNQDIQNLEVQIPMYEELNRRTDQMLIDIDDDGLANVETVKKYLNDHFDSKSKPEGVDPDGPTHNEMIEDLLIQLKENLEKAKQDPNNGVNLRKEMLGHRKKIDEVLINHKDKLRTLLKERELHISSDDMHTGWDRSFLNKGKSDSAAAGSSVSSSSKSPESATSTITDVSTAKSAPSTNVTSTTESSSSNDTSVATSKIAADQTSNDAKIEDIHSDTLKYSQLPITDMKQIKSFLKEHTNIINPQQKDALLMKAFDSQLELNEARTKQIIYLSTLLQYIYDIIEFKRAKHPQEIGVIIDQLLGKMFTGVHNPALDAFEQEIKRTFLHIKQRCEIISQESNEEQEGEEEIQLKSLNDDTELIVNLPDPNSDDPEEKKRFEIFKTIPEKMQAALKTGSLDEVNNVFHGIPILEAEEILEKFEQCQVIGVQAVLENEQDWKEIKKEYQSQFEESEDHVQGGDHAPKIEELEINEPEISTGDIVD